MTIHIIVTGSQFV